MQNAPDSSKAAGRNLIVRAFADEDQPGGADLIRSAIRSTAARCAAGEPADAGAEASISRGACGCTSGRCGVAVELVPAPKGDPGGQALPDLLTDTCGAPLPE